jgi:hypothetical protein
MTTMKRRTGPVWLLVLALLACLAGRLLADTCRRSETAIRASEWNKGKDHAHARAECGQGESLTGGGGECAYGRLYNTAPAANGWEADCATQDLGRQVQARSFAVCMKSPG